MDTGIIHNDDRVGTRELVHVVQESIDKTVELFCGVRVVLNSKMEDPIEREGRKNRVAVSW